ncbi:MAG: imelysin [Lewinellaceae bacterium]|nr:imelysin [Lewinellaceae bacterium]
MHKPSIILLLSVIVLFAACKKTEVTPDEDFSPVLTNLSENVILNTYLDLKDKASALQTATQNLEADPNTANLEIARTAWAAARSPWEQSEGFLFGPVDQEGLDPSLDSWPVNVTDLNNVLNGGNALTPEFLQAQEGTLKGFHTIEYLLWGTDSQKAVADFTAREFEYLAACSAVLASDAAQLYERWAPAGGDYIANVLNAGKTGSIYPSQKAALEEMANALSIIADEVGNGKINDPFSQQDLSLEESRFSNNSKADFANNIRSIKNIYTGKYLTFGTLTGLSAVIADRDAALDVRLKTEIDAAIAAIEAIPGTFGDAVFNNASAVSDAQTKVRTIQQTLESDILPLISKL